MLGSEPWDRLYASAKVGWWILSQVCEKRLFTCLLNKYDAEDKEMSL